jgi:hypothetical protein
MLCPNRKSMITKPAIDRGLRAMTGPAKIGARHCDPMRQATYGLLQSSHTHL